MPSNFSPSSGRNRYGSRLWRWIKQGVATGLGAIAFYTCLPMPPSWPLHFAGIAAWAPAVGVLLGGGLGLIGWALFYAGFSPFLVSILLVSVWIGITGGLHLDGAMDSADGLAVLDPDRRLEVMADSRSGAFGVMAAILLVLLKVAALTDLSHGLTWALMLAGGWGRWGQLIAIWRYPYLKSEGKGAFHKAAIQSIWQVMPASMVLVALSGLLVASQTTTWAIAVAITCCAAGIPFLTGAWFNHKLGGHTGDSYGAVVEWSEALILCVLTLLL